MQVTGTQQQAAWQQRIMPPVERLADGLWSIPVPVPDNPVRYVLTYVFAHDAGALLIDPGWNHPDAWAALGAGLAECGVGMESVTGVVATHVHPDHHGLSGRVREVSDAWVGLHPAEDATIGNYGPNGTPGFDEHLQRCGAPAEHRRLLQRMRTESPLPPMVHADRLLEDGSLLDAKGLRIRVIWTPGHTPGHICLYDEGRNLLLTGDHILPRITPNVSAHDVSRPFADYLRSMRRLRGIDPAEVLPAHEYRFTDLDSRLDAIGIHHDERNAEILGVVADAGATGLTTWQAAERVTWSRGWDQLEGFNRQSAVGEVLAHLRYLEDLGEVRYAEPGDDDPADASPAGRWTRGRAD